MQKATFTVYYVMLNSIIQFLIIIFSGHYHAFRLNKYVVHRELQSLIVADTQVPRIQW